MRVGTHLLLIATFYFTYVIPTFCQIHLGSRQAVIVDMKVIQEKEWVIANLGGSIEVWNYNQKTLVKSWASEKITCIDVRNGRVAGASATGRVVVWDLESGSSLLDKKVSDKVLTAIAWVDDESIVVGGESSALYKILTATGEVVSHASSETTALALGKDHTLLAGDAVGNVVIYDASTMTAKKSDRPHQQSLRQFVVSDSLPSFYTVSDDGKLCSWSEKEMASSSCRKFGNWLLAADVVDFKDATKRVLAMGTRNGELIVDVAFGSYKAKLGAMVTGVEVIRNTLPDITLVVATYGNGIQLWNAKEMRFHK